MFISVLYVHITVGDDYIQIWGYKKDLPIVETKIHVANNMENENAHVANNTVKPIVELKFFRNLIFLSNGRWGTEDVYKENKK